jgi:chromosome partitioning protein
VLAVDADPQGNLSDYFDTDPNAQPTLGTCSWARSVPSTRSTAASIPANLQLAEAELALSGKIGREVTLRQALMDLKRRPGS